MSETIVLMGVGILFFLVIRMVLRRGRTGRGESAGVAGDGGSVESGHHSWFHFGNDHGSSGDSGGGGDGGGGGD